MDLGAEGSPGPIEGLGRYRIDGIRARGGWCRPGVDVRMGGLGYRIGERAGIRASGVRIRPGWVRIRSGWAWRLRRHRRFRDE
jgi:hypothetical protein